MAGILLLAAILRLYHLNELPYTNDELSAIYRAQYNTFNELINLGIKPDGHPVLIQLLLFYYIKIVGTSAWIIKMPFILSGIIVVFVSYKITAITINRNLGILVAAYIATSQYFILYSQLARPYMPGLLFVLLALYFGLQILLHHKRKLRDYAMLCFFILASVSTHHFAGLTIFIISIVLLLAEMKAFKMNLIYTFTVACILYSPQVPILLAQLNTGGIGGTTGWLGKPDGLFIIQYIKYVGQYFLLTYILIFLVIPVTIFSLYKAPKREMLVLVAGVSIFALTFITGYYYSIFRNPVLQYAVLIFAAPYLLVVLFYGVSRWRQQYFLIFTGILLCTNLYGLIFNRMHFQLNYNQGYQASVAGITKYSHLPLLLNGNSPDYYRFYFSKYRIQPNVIYFHFDTIPYASFRSKIQQITSDTLVISYGMPGNPIYVGLAQWYYPTIINKEEGAAFETYILTKQKSEPVDTGVITSVSTRDQFNSEKEFGSTLKSMVLNSGNNDLLQAYVKIKPISNTAINPQLVCVLKDENDKQVLWFGASYQDFYLPSDSITPILIRFRIPTSVPEGNLKLETFVWNIHQEEFQASAIQTQLIQGNKFLFGLVNDFH